MIDPLAGGCQQSVNNLSEQSLKVRFWAVLKCPVRRAGSGLSLPLLALLPSGPRHAQGKPRGAEDRGPSPYSFLQ